MCVEPPFALPDLYPGLTQEQFQEADASLERFLAVVVRIAERLQAEGVDLASPDLTVMRDRARIPDEKVELPTNK